MAQVYALKTKNGPRLFKVGRAKLVLGAPGYAEANSELHGDFLVINMATPTHIESCVEKIKQKIQQLPAGPGADKPMVEWVRPLTRRMQRLFGWGDVQTTKEAVQTAVDKEDEGELLAIMPQAASVIQCGNPGRLKCLPAVFDIMHSGQPALTDCRSSLTIRNNCAGNGFPSWAAWWRKTQR
jgi:hypothetical protein